MEKYDLKSVSLPVPEEWKYLRDSDHAIQYAAYIFKDNHLHALMCLQHEDFQGIFKRIKCFTLQDLEKRAYVAFQVQFQSECLQEAWRLIKAARLLISR